MSAGLPWVQLKGRRVTLTELGDATPASESEAEIIHFCRSWQRGEETFMLHTSGSTGEPKPLQVSRREMEQTAKLQNEALGLRPGMTALLCLHHRFVAGKMMMVRCMTGGMNLVVTPPAANPLENLPGQLRIDFTAMVPYQVESIINSGDWSSFNADARLIIGGAAINSRLLEKIVDIPVDAYATFGMTETISHIALQKLNGATKADSYETLNGVTVSSDARGCLVIAANHLAVSPIITNDLIELIDPTHFRWQGRWDNVINSGGVKVIPEQAERVVEQIFRKLGLTGRFFVAGIPHQSLGQLTTLFIEEPVDVETIKKVYELVRVSFGAHDGPKKIIGVANFAETVSSKINRKETVREIVQSLVDDLARRPKSSGRG